MEETKETYTPHKKQCNNYCDLITDIVKNTKDTWILEQIYKFSLNMTKEG